MKVGRILGRFGQRDRNNKKENNRHKEKQEPLKATFMAYYFHTFSGFLIDMEFKLFVMRLQFVVGLPEPHRQIK